MRHEFSDQEWNIICASPLLRAQSHREVLQQDTSIADDIATRYDKLAANYLAFVQLASIRLWLCVYEFTA